MSEMYGDDGTGTIFGLFPHFLRMEMLQLRGSYRSYDLQQSAKQSGYPNIPGRCPHVNKILAISVWKSRL